MKRAGCLGGPSALVGHSVRTWGPPPQLRGLEGTSITLPHPATVLSG